MPTFNPSTSTGLQYTYKNTDIPAGNTISNTLLNNPEGTFASAFTVPAGGLVGGMVIDVWAAGVFSAALNVGNLTIKLKVNSTVIANITTPINLLTNNKGWTFDTWSIVMADNKVETQGQGNFAGAVMPINNTASYTIDSTVDMVVTMTAQFGAIGLGNSIQLRQLICSVA